MLRAILFNFAFYLTTAIMSIAFLPLLFLPRTFSIAAAKFWGHVSLWLARVVCGIRLEVRGREHIAANGGVIYASKHQSAFDTVALNALLPAPAYILKRELLFLPLYGLYLWRIGCVAVDRSAGASAMKQMVREAKERIAEKRSLIIFPEGTRTPPGMEDPTYHPGVAALYTQAGAKIVPVALNSGICWGRNAILKRPGTVVIEFLPPIEPGQMDRKAFSAHLKALIETQSKALL